VNYRNAVFDGEEVQALVTSPTVGGTYAEIWMQKSDGTEVLRGSISLARDASDTALQRRLASLKPVGPLVILRDIRIGMKSKRQRSGWTIRRIWVRSILSPLIRKFR
jgi:hypothetical protein